MLDSSVIRPRRGIARMEFSEEKPANAQKKETDVQNNDRAITCNENFRQYLLNSTLHGLRYVGETQISVFERVFFVIAFLLVFVLSIYFISNIYQKWSASPIIIGLNAVATPISDIPFPAVTICNMNQARKSYVRDIEGNTINGALLQSLCQLEVEGETTEMPANFTGKWSLFRQFLLQVSQPCADMLMHCRYATKVEKCMELFNTVLTDDGLCCTFNGVHPMFLLTHYNGSSSDEFDSVNDTGDLTPADWTPEMGWGSYDRKTTYPRPAAGSGSHMGLFVTLNAELNDYYCSSTNSKGFKVLLHNPTETPKITDYGFALTVGMEARVVVTPRISDASRLIKSVPTHQRQCIFANEGNLSYFRTYSRKNCQMECESRIINEMCGCVQYYMPRVSEDTKICSRQDYACFNKVSLAIDVSFNESYQCACLPGCFEIYYKPSVYSASLGTGNFSVREKFLKEMDPVDIKSSIAVVHIYYEESFFRSYTKEELIGFTEFLSSTGGLLGLFMGFSVVSIIEIIYFLSLRPYCAQKRHHNVQKTVSSNESSAGKLWYMDTAEKRVHFEASATANRAFDSNKLHQFKDSISNTGRSWMQSIKRRFQQIFGGNTVESFTAEQTSSKRRFPYTE